MVKRLRAAGVEAEFLDPADQQTFEVKKSVEALVLAVVLGVVSSAAWEGIKAFFRSRSKGKSQLHALILRALPVSVELPGKWKVMAMPYWMPSIDLEVTIWEPARLRPGPGSGPGSGGRGRRRTGCPARRTVRTTHAPGRHRCARQPGPG